ncbi:hypothetical protein [Amycolatopsis sp. CA-230715]|uniref:hypothetical protein n=1 Tax=Amycolatopsis sp. CA-230715 TaxID=2745196 RepID=UPI001C00ED9B|nr:hypothetical protein [Amycolatopsis sp. CA-230715]QWF78978.1 hypothetical protein HUW46_02378 [Amycolatopsis sp. CA-230715]
MAITSKFRRTATVTALSALVGGSALATAGTATAASSDYPFCVPGQLNASVTENQAPDDGRLFALELEAKPGVSCQIQGAPSGLTFYNGDTIRDMPVITPEPGSAQPYTIDEQHPGIAYISTPAKSSDPVPVSKISFTLPAGGGLSADWPGAIDGPVRLGNIGPAVS